MPIKVLIVDDSAVVRQTFERELSTDNDIEVIGTAPDPYIARDKIISLKPDVITLDIEMPRMDGLTFLKKLMAHMPIPVIIVSSLSKQGSEIALEALESGAIDVMCKPGSSFSVGDMSIELKEKIKSAAQANIQLALKQQKQFKPTGSIKPKITSSLTKTTEKVVLIGSSTGGTQALENLLEGYPPNCPPTVVVQHMPAGFTKAFSERLNNIFPFEVKEAVDGDSVLSGRVLIAPGNLHTMIKRSGAQYFVEVKEGPLVGHHRPSVDVLFHSGSEILGKNAIGVMLTGMGSDGAKGMLKMKEAGAVNIGQDEATSVVYGMPKAAFEIGAINTVLPLDKIATEILELYKK